MTNVMIIADDFGLDVGINSAVEQIFERGTLTAASLLANGSAFDDAVRRAHANPTWNIGMHLNLTEGPPVLPPEEIPSLVNEKGLFKWTTMQLLIALFFRMVNQNDVAKEIKAQFEKYINTGLRLTHINGHQHVHIIPSVLRVVISLAKHYNITFIRYPYESLRWENIVSVRRTIKQVALNGVCAYSRRIFLKNNIIPRYKFYGFFCSGRLTKKHILAVINEISENSLEIMCHPGEASIDYEPRDFRTYSKREYELRALLDNDVKNILEERLIRAF